jgi:prepilin-type N-terminal cleavage/methylation domain-containing protein
MHRTPRAAFTLIEMVITVSIISILLAIAIPNMMGYRRGAEKEGCQDQMRSILSAIEEARLERDYDVINPLKASGPHSIDDLVPRYLPESFGCPSGGGAYTVSYDEDRDTFSVACPNAASKGHTL